MQGNSVSQIDYVFLRRQQSNGPGKQCQPDRSFPVAQWRSGSRHFPLIGKIQHSRRYSAVQAKPYDQQSMESCYRQDGPGIAAFRQQVERRISQTNLSWESLTATMEQALKLNFPKRKALREEAREINPWKNRLSLRTLPLTAQVISELNPQSHQRMVLRCWQSLAEQGAKAKEAKREKQRRRQEQVDALLADAENVARQDGTHSLYAVIRRFKSGKPQERVQLRDEHGRFLTPAAEVKQLRENSEDLFSTGSDFPLTGRRSKLHIQSAEVKEQLASIKIGKAVPIDSPPVVAWRSLGPKAHQRIADILNSEIESSTLSESISSSQISWLPKPPKKPDKPSSLRPIGVIAPEGKVLAGILRKRFKPTLKRAMTGVAQFGFVPGKGTEEAICKALTHMDESKQRSQATMKAPGRGQAGLRLRGSLAMSVDMSKAFDTVDRVKLREALEASEADPNLIEVVGLLHVKALYRMTASDQQFEIATRRGIKQGCKLAPSLFAFATGLLFQKLSSQITLAELTRMITMYADDTLLQKHFNSFEELQEALACCDILLDQLESLGFKVNPTKSAILIQLHGGSAQTARSQICVKKDGARYVQLPSGRLISLKTQVPYLGIVLSYQNYEMKTLNHRIAASKKAMAEVAHAVRNSRALTERRRLSIWTITSWASALYALRVVGLTHQGLGKLQSHMAYQLRFVLRSYSRDTKETNQELLRRLRLKSAKEQVIKRLAQFVKRQRSADPSLLPLYLPRAIRLQSSRGEPCRSGQGHGAPPG